MMDDRKFRRKHRSPIETVSVLKSKRESEEEIQARLEAEREAELRRIALERIAARKEREAEKQIATERAQAEAEARKVEDDTKRLAAEQARLTEEKQVAEAAAAELAEIEAKTRADADRRAEAANRAEVREATRLAEELPETQADELPLAEESRPTAEISQRAQPEQLASPAIATEPNPSNPWDNLTGFTVDIRHLSRNRIVTAEREDPAHIAFDVLRTRLLQALSDNGWNRVAITSPTKDCGKTFTAANLSISLSRQESIRTLLLDLDMRRPSLHRVIGVEKPGSMGEMLRGNIPPEKHLMRLDGNPFNASQHIACGFNGVIEPNASELLQDPRTAKTLDAIEEQYEPDVMLIDLPPALYYDDVIASRPLFDGVLMVIGGGTTTEKEVKEVERRLGESTPLLGMVLNKAENTELDRYKY